MAEITDDPFAMEDDGDHSAPHHPSQQTTTASYPHQVAPEILDDPFAIDEGPQAENHHDTPEIMTHDPFAEEVPTSTSEGSPISLDSSAAVRRIQSQRLSNDCSALGNGGGECEDTSDPFSVADPHKTPTPTSSKRLVTGASSRSREHTPQTDSVFDANAIELTHVAAHKNPAKKAQPSVMFSTLSSSGSYGGGGGLLNNPSNTQSVSSPVYAANYNESNMSLIGQGAIVGAGGEGAVVFGMRGAKKSANGQSNTSHQHANTSNVGGRSNDNEGPAVVYVPSARNQGGSKVGGGKKPGVGAAKSVTPKLTEDDDFDF